MKDEFNYFLLLINLKFCYRLEELVGNVVVKREVTSGNKFGEFVGSKLIKYNIVNAE